MRVPRIDDSPRLAQVVRRLREGQHEYFGGEVRGIRPTERIVRPASEVVKLDAQLPAGHRKIVVKLFRLGTDSPARERKLRNRVQKDFDITRRFHQKFAGFPDSSTAEPIVCYPELYALVMVDAPGESLGALIARHGRYRPRKRTLDRLSRDVAACGHFLRDLQRMTEIEERLDPSVVVDEIVHRVDKLTGLGVRAMDARLRHRILAHAEALASRTSPADLAQCGVHADFCPGNVLIDSGKITVLDFTMFRVGSALHDVTYYCRNLANFLHKPVFRPGTIAILQRAFLDAYDENLDPTSPLFRLLSLRHVVSHYIGVSKRQVPLHERLFNRWVSRRHADWIRTAVADTVEQGRLAT